MSELDDIADELYGLRPDEFAAARDEQIHKARAEKNPEARLGWLSRSEEEFRRAVEAAPDDWDTKFDYELTGRLAAELRKQPKNPPNQLMQLLRPQPKMGPKPPKRVG